MEAQKHTPDYLTANYHTHTMRCGHAVGADEEYVKAAAAAGMQVLGFSDHIPWPDKVPPRDTLHMRMNRAAEYAASVCALREKYRDRITIYLGFEAEYLPEFSAIRILWISSEIILFTENRYVGFARGQRRWGFLWKSIFWASEKGDITRPRNSGLLPGR